MAVVDARAAYQLLTALELSLGALDLSYVLRGPDEPNETRPVIGRWFHLALRGELRAE